VAEKILSPCIKPLGPIAAGRRRRTRAISPGASESGQVWEEPQRRAVPSGAGERGEGKTEALEADFAEHPDQATKRTNLASRDGQGLPESRIRDRLLNASGQVFLLDQHLTQFIRILDRRHQLVEHVFRFPVEQLPDHHQVAFDFVVKVLHFAERFQRGVLTARQ